MGYCQDCSEREATHIVVSGKNEQAFLVCSDCIKGDDNVLDYTEDTECPYGTFKDDNTNTEGK